MGVTEGAYAAHSLANDVAGKVATGELKWGDGSAQSYLDNQRNTILQQHGWDPSSYQARGFGQAYNELWQKAGTQGVGAAATAENDRLKQTATSQIEMAVDAAQKAKLDPAATWQKIDEARRTAITYGHYEAKELDPMVFDALNRRMATDPNWVMAAGNHPRTDLNDPSQTIPPLFANPAFINQASNMAQRTQTFNAPGGRSEPPRRTSTPAFRPSSTAQTRPPSTTSRRKFRT
jgi:hypothetical protein